MPPRKLLDQVSDALRRQHYSYRTEQAYVDWIKRYILFHHKRHPAEMGAPEVEAFLNHLAIERTVAGSTQNQALAALLYLYREVLRQPLDAVHLRPAHKSERMPTVLTQAEVRQVLEQLSGIHQLMARLLYGSGLRLMECVRLRVKDVDFGHGQIVVREGKGDKDRVTMLPASLAQPLRDQIERVKALHQADLRAGHGAVELPTALARKYPNAPRELGWQFIFSASCANSSMRLFN
jgi:integron integrase